MTRPAALAAALRILLLGTVDAVAETAWCHHVRPGDTLGAVARRPGSAWRSFGG